MSNNNKTNNNNRRKYVKYEKRHFCKRNFKSDA